jgi:hypothetical protein
MVAAMNRMATLAVFFYRRMLPNCRAALIGVTFETELPRVIGPNHTFTQAAVGYVTG